MSRQPPPGWGAICLVVLLAAVLILTGLVYLVLGLKGGVR